MNSNDETSEHDGAPHVEKRVSRLRSIKMYPSKGPNSIRHK